MTASTTNPDAVKDELVLELRRRHDDEPLNSWKLDTFTDFGTTGSVQLYGFFDEDDDERLLLKSDELLDVRTEIRRREL